MRTDIHLKRIITAVCVMAATSFAANQTIFAEESAEGTVTVSVSEEVIAGDQTGVSATDEEAAEETSAAKKKSKVTETTAEETDAESTSKAKSKKSKKTKEEAAEAVETTDQEASTETTPATTTQAVVTTTAATTTAVQVAETAVSSPVTTEKLEVVVTEVTEQEKTDEDADQENSSKDAASGEAKTQPAASKTSQEEQSEPDHKTEYQAELEAQVQALEDRLQTLENKELKRDITMVVAVFAAVLGFVGFVSSMNAIAHTEILEDQQRFERTFQDVASGLYRSRTAIALERQKLSEIPDDTTMGTVRADVVSALDNVSKVMDHMSEMVTPEPDSDDSDATPDGDKAGKQSLK